MNIYRRIFLVISVSLAVCCNSFSKASDISPETEYVIKQVLHVKKNDWKHVMYCVKMDSAKIFPRDVKKIMDEYQSSDEGYRLVLIMNELAPKMSRSANKKLEDLVMNKSDSLRVYDLSHSDKLIELTPQTDDVANLVFVYMLENVLSTEAKETKAYYYIIKSLLSK